MSKTLILNATFEPISVVSLKRAMLLVLAEKAVIVAEGEGQVRSASTSFPVPSVIRLTHFVKIPFRAKARLTNRGVLIRDKHTCAYCGKHATTIDHIIPKSRGGRHMWTNVVAACRPCNSKKDNKTLDELGWRLPSKPETPLGTKWFIIGLARIEPDWEPYLGGAFSLATA